MKKTLLVVLGLILMLSVSCDREKNDIDTEAYCTFCDSVGNEITLYEKPSRVAVLFSSYADVWKLSDGEIYATVGESVERGFAASEVLLVDGGAGKTIDNELLLSYEPDFIIGSADIPAQVKTAELMNAIGVPTALFRVESFEEYLDMLKICCDITDSPENYIEYGENVEQAVNKLLETADYSDIDILFIRSGSKYSSTKAKTKDNNFVCRMLYDLGTYNIAENAEILLDGLSIEEIILSDPDYIFISTMGDEKNAEEYMESLFAEDRWQTLQAVKNGNYCYLPKNLFQFKPNAEWHTAYRYLAQTLDGIKGKL